MQDMREAVILPHSETAERAVLGAIILENQSIYRVLDFLTKDDFYSNAHGILYRHCERLISSSLPVDFVTLLDELRRHDELEAVGGIGYVAAIIDDKPIPENIEHYGRIVKEKHTLRELAQIAYAISEKIGAGEEGSSDILDFAESRLSLITANKAIPIQSFEELATEQIADYRKQSEFDTPTGTEGIPSKLTDLDDVTQGFQRSELVIIAGRPSTGKTALACTITDNATEAGYKVGFISLEMRSKAIFRRLVSKRTHIDGRRLQAGKLSGEEWKAAHRESMNIGARTGAWLIDCAGMKLSQIRSVCKRVKITEGLDMVVIDYVGLIRHGFRNQSAKRYEIVTEISHQLKEMAGDLNIALLLLAQLNREITGYEEPDLHNLRESGDLEQDADTVLFTWLKKTHPRDPNSEIQNILTVAKQRNGPAPERIRVAFRKELTAFFNYSSSME